MKTIFKLSLNNLLAYKKIYIKIICALVALLFLITLICSFTLSINNRQKAILYGSISSNYAYTDYELKAGDVNQSYQTVQLKSVVIDKDVVTELVGYGSFIYLDSTAIVMDDESYNCKDFVWVFDAYVVNDGLFTRNDYKEAGANASFLLGRYPQSANEVALSERYINKCGLSRDILGKTISINVIKQIVVSGGFQLQPDGTVIFSPPEYEYKSVPFVENVTVCGIIADEYYKLSGHDGKFHPTLLCHEQGALATEYDLQTEYIYSLDEWANKQTKQFFDDNKMYYAGEWELKEIDVTINLQLVVNQLVAYFGSALIFGIIFTLILLCEKLCSAQMKNSGVLLMSGLTNKQLFCVWLVQLAIAALIAVVVATGITFGAMYGINGIMYNAFSLRLTVTAATFFEIMAIGFAAVAVVTVAALGYFAIIFRHRQTRELLDT